MSATRAPAPSSAVPGNGNGSAAQLRAIVTIARYTLLEALHSRIAVAALIAIALGIGFGQFTDMLALTDSNGIRAATLAEIGRAHV